MFARKPWQRVLLATCFLDLYFLGCEAAGSQHEDQPWSLALEQLFGSIDEDGDGQIGQAEALQYIDANFDSLDIQEDPRTAAQQMSTNLDGSDSDATVSKKEVEEHLRKLLKGNRVAEWLKHCAQMPQYVQAFRDNSITSLDFPMLVADGGVTLETDLGVKSKLHKEQLTRALKRVILGIGTNPGPPRELQCMPLSCESIVIRWQPPEKPGAPPLHRYKLERQRTRVLSNEVVAAPVWETANGDLDEEDTSWVDTDLQVGEYAYRITAWNALGWSEYAILPGCNTADASLSCPRNKCWSEAVCTAFEQGDGMDTASGAAAMSWSLAWSLGGVALGCLFLSSQFLTFRQRRALFQNPVAKKCEGLLRVEATDRAGEAALHPAVEPEGSIGQQLILTSPSQRDLDSPRLSRRHGSSPTLQDADRASAFRQLAHNDSCKLSSRDGASGGSSPRRSSQLQAARMDLFFPDEVETYRGSEPQSSLPNLRVANRALLSGEQEVVWLDDEGIAVRPPPVLDIPPSPHQTSRNACGFPSCEKSLHPIFNPKAAMTSHYCSICQNIFCQRHTRYSPHGRLGSCGMESKCICQICFDDLPPLTQERLERTNKLPPQKDLQPSTTEGSGTARPERGRRGGTLFGGVKLSTHYSGQAESSSAGGAGSSELRQQQLQYARSDSREGASRNWSLLRNAWQAAMRFRGAARGRQRQSGHESPQQKPLETDGRGRSTH